MGQTSVEIQAETIARFFGTTHGDTSKPLFSFTRPADTNIYAIGDTVGTITSETSSISVPSKVSGTTGQIQGGQLITDAIISGMIVNCFLFSEDVSHVADNAAPTETYANIIEKLVSVIVFSSAYSFGTNNVFTGEVTSYNSFQRKGIDTKLHTVFTAGSAFTPTSEQNFSLLLDTI